MTESIPLSVPQRDVLAMFDDESAIDVDRIDSRCLPALIRKELVSVREGSVRLTPLGRRIAAEFAVSPTGPVPEAPAPVPVPQSTPRNQKPGSSVGLDEPTYRRLRNEIQARYQADLLDARAEIARLKASIVAKLAAEPTEEQVEAAAREYTAILRAPLRTPFEPWDVQSINEVRRILAAAKGE